MGDNVRLRLIIPVAIVLTSMWALAGLRWLVTGDVQGFLVVTGPFTGFCGYVFGIALFRKPE